VHTNGTVGLTTQKRVRDARVGWIAHIRGCRDE